MQGLGPFLSYKTIFPMGPALELWPQEPEMLLGGDLEGPRV